MASALYLTAAKPVKADAKSLAGVIVANGGPAKPGGWAARRRSTAGGWRGQARCRDRGRRGAAAAPTMSLIAALGAAFVGGLILNLMPCVFPVLSLKLIGLAQHRTHSGPMAAHGVAFAVGRGAVVRAAGGAADRACSRPAARSAGASSCRRRGWSPR